MSLGGNVLKVDIFNWYICTRGVQVLLEGVSYISKCFM